MYNNSAKWNEKELQDIKDRAYFKWVDADKPEGQDQHFWQLAEEELIYQRGEEIIELTFPVRKENSKCPWNSPWINSSWDKFIFDYERKTFQSFM